MVDVADELAHLVDHFATAAGVDPVSAILLAGGTLLVGAAVAVGAWLTLGAIAEGFGAIGD